MADTVKHTSGPWEYIDATKSAKYKFAPTCVIKAGDKQVASFSWNDNSPWFPTREQSQANALLIAAAPDLLEVAKETLRLFRYNVEDAADAADFAAEVELKLEAAIAKATGGQCCPLSQPPTHKKRMSGKLTSKLSTRKLPRPSAKSA